MTRILSLVAFLVLSLLACNGGDRSADADSAVDHGDPTSEVLVLGMIHSGHRDSETYGLDVVKRIVRAADPDYVLAEIPPDRLSSALESYRTTGVVQEERVERFPEYTDAIIPLSEEMKFQIIPCAAWTEEMADARSTKLAQWEETRAADSEEVDRAQVQAEETITREDLDAGPLGIHTPRYDELVKQGLEPYDRLFNDDLGLGGWTNINAAHYALIEQALDEQRGEGRRFLVTFGAWHKYWILEKLRRRDDVTILELEGFLRE